MRSTGSSALALVEQVDPPEPRLPEIPAGRTWLQGAPLVTGGANLLESVGRAAASPASSGATPSRVDRGSGNARILVLLDRGVVEPGELIYFQRNGRRHGARITADGCVQLDDGRCFPALSTAATALVGYSRNGWKVWRVARLGGRCLEELEQRIPAQRPVVARRPVDAAASRRPEVPQQRWDWLRTPTGSVDCLPVGMRNRWKDHNRIDDIGGAP